MYFYNDDPIDGCNASLPTTMAGLLETAIGDARRLDRTTYTPHSDRWHQSNSNSFCEICLAGCLIAGTLEIPPSDSVTAHSFDDRTMELLNALDNMRYGY